MGACTPQNGCTAAKQSRQPGQAPSSFGILGRSTASISKDQLGGVLNRVLISRQWRVMTARPTTTSRWQHWCTVEPSAGASCRMTSTRRLLGQGCRPSSGPPSNRLDENLAYPQAMVPHVAALPMAQTTVVQPSSCMSLRQTLGQHWQQSLATSHRAPRSNGR